MIKYTIYEIYCKDEIIQNVYVGHTKNFEQRMKTHKYACSRNNDINKQSIHKFINLHGGWNNWYTKEIEIIECDKITAREREQYWISKKNTSGLNIARAYVSEKKIYIEKKIKSILKNIKLKKKLLSELENQLSKKSDNTNENYKKKYDKYKIWANKLKRQIEFKEDAILQLKTYVEKIY